jgi:hypothetical protein
MAYTSALLFNRDNSKKWKRKFILQVWPLLGVYQAKQDRLYGLVARVLGYRSGGPGSTPGTTRFSEKKKKEKNTVVGLEWGQLSLVSTTEELLDRKVVAPV